MDGEVFILFNQDPAQFTGKMNIRHRGDQIVLDDLIDLRGRGGAQYDDGSLDPADPELHPLVRVGNAKRIYTVLHGGL